MAINHKFSAFEEPFNFRGRVISMSPGESPKVSGNAIREAAEKAAKADNFLKETGKIKKTVEKRGTDEKEVVEFQLEDLTKHITDVAALKLMNDLPAQAAEVIQEHVKQAITRLSVIKGMYAAGIFTEPEYKGALRQFDNVYSDLHLSEADVATLIKLQRNATERVALRSEHSKVVAERAVAAMNSVAERSQNTREMQAAQDLFEEGLDEDTTMQSVSQTKLDYADALPDETTSDTSPTTAPTDTEATSSRAAIYKLATADQTPEYDLPLQGQSAVLPDFFRGTTTYEEIDRMRDLDNGGASVYEAISALTDIRSDVLGETDRHTVWHELVSNKLLRKDGSKAEITFNELCLATFGRNEEKILAAMEGDEMPKGLSVTPEQFEQFKRATALIMHYGELLEESDVGAEQYRELRESAELTGEFAEMDALAGQIFEKNSYGPMIKLGLVKRIYYGLSSKDRPIVTEDTWTSVEARKQKYTRHGELEFVSHARAYDRLMATDNMTAMVEELNRYILLGNAMMRSLNTAEKDAAKRPGTEDTEAETAEATQIGAEGINLTTALDGELQLTEKQIEAIRHGAMIVAAQETRIFQDVQAEMAQEGAEQGAEGNEVSDELMRVLSRKGDLSDEELESIARELPNGLGGMMSVLADQAFNLSGSASLNYGLSRGHELILVEADGTVVGTLDALQGKDLSLLQPAIRSISTGHIYTSKRFGKKRKLRHMSVRKLGATPTGKLEASWGEYLKYDFKEGGVWSAVGGIQANLEQASVVLGVERDFDRLYRKKLNEYKEKHAEQIAEATMELDLIAEISLMDPNAAEIAIQARAEGKTAAEIRSILEEQNLTTSIPTVELETLKDAMHGYLDMLIDQGYIKDWTKFTKQIKFAGAGVCASARWRKGKNGRRGYGVGVYATFAYGFHEQKTHQQTIYTEVVSKEVAENVEGQTPAEAQPEWAEITVPKTVIYHDKADQQTAESEAIWNANQVVGTMSRGMGEHIELVQGENLTELKISDVQGTVKLMIDPEFSGVQLIQTAPDGLALNLGREDTPIARIETRNVGQSARLETVIVITNDPTASIKEVESRTSGYITWNEVETGNNTHVRRPSRIMGAQSNLYNLGQAIDAMHGKGPEPRQFEKGDLCRSEAVNDAELHRLEFEHQKRSLMLEERQSIQLTPKMREIGEKISKDFPLDSIHKSGEGQRVVDAITEQFEAASIEPTDDAIAAVYNYANRVERPDGPFLNWSIKAVEEFFGEEDGKLFAEFIDAHREELTAKNLDVGYGQLLPEGAATATFVDEDNTLLLIDGFYSKETMGEVIGLVELSDLEAITRLGGDKGDPATEEMLQRIQKKIIQYENWPSRVADPLKYLNEIDPTIQNVAKTDVGRLLQLASTDIWGTDAAKEIADMIRTGNETNRELAADFKGAVKELLNGRKFITSTNKALTAKIAKIETYLSFHGDCVNPQISYNPRYQLDYEWDTPTEETPETMVAKAGNIESVQESAMPQKTVIAHRTATIPVAMGRISKGKTPDVEADEADGAWVGRGAERGQSEDVEGADRTLGDAS